MLLERRYGDPTQVTEIEAHLGRLHVHPLGVEFRERTQEISPCYGKFPFLHFMQVLGFSVRGLSFEANEGAVFTASQMRTRPAVVQGIPQIIHSTTSSSGDRAKDSGRGQSNSRAPLLLIWRPCRRPVCRRAGAICSEQIDGSVRSGRTAGHAHTRDRSVGLSWPGHAGRSCLRRFDARPAGRSYDKFFKQPLW